MTADPAQSEAAQSEAGGALVGVVIPAAGQGVRLGGGGPKALREIAGEPILAHAIRSLVSSGYIDAIVIAAPADDVALVAELAARVAPGAHITVTAGGATRQESVANGLAELPEAVGIVLVHDAARPFVPAEVIARVVDAVKSGADAVVPVVPIADTLRGFEDGRFVGVIDRDSLRAIQTPQGFRRQALVAAHAAAAADLTDDAGLVESMGGSVVAVAGHDEAFKITRPFDLLVAQALIASRSTS